MSGEIDLSKVLSSLEPTLDEEIYVFAKTTEPIDLEELDPRLTFVEEEGITLVLRKSRAEALEMEYEFPCRMITLGAVSSLDAVGLIAAVATRLAEAGISVNPVAGFHHDHLFVPEARANDAMAALRALSESDGPR